MRPTRAILHSSRALVVVVVPCTTACRLAGSAPADSSAAMKPMAWLSTVVDTLASFTAPDTESTESRSVNVPPTSMPTVEELLDEDMMDQTERYCSRRAASAM